MESADKETDDRGVKRIWKGMKCRVLTGGCGLAPLAVELQRSEPHFPLELKWLTYIFYY